MKDESLIPKGMYCYDEKGKCPYWSRRDDLPSQENGYCSFLEKSDFDINEEMGDIPWKNGKGEIEKTTEAHEIPMGLLWDQCKECGINEWTDEELEELVHEQNNENWSIL